MVESRVGLRLRICRRYRPILVLVASALRQLFHNPPSRLGVCSRFWGIAFLLLEEFWQDFFLDYRRRAGAVELPVGLGEVESQRTRTRGQRGRALGSGKTSTRARSISLAVGGGPASFLQCVAP